MALADEDARKDCFQMRKVINRSLNGERGTFTIGIQAFTDQPSVMPPLGDVCSGTFLPVPARFKKSYAWILLLCG